MSISKFHFETFPATSKFEILDTCRHLDCDPLHQHIRLFRILFTNFLEFTQIPVPCRDHGEKETWSQRCASRLAKTGNYRVFHEDAIEGGTNAILGLCHR